MMMDVVVVVVVVVANWIVMSLAIEIVMGQKQSKGVTLLKGLRGWPTRSVG